MTRDPRYDKFLEVLFDEAGGNFHKAKEIAGFAKGTRTSYIVSQIEEDIVEATKKFIISNGVKAAYAMKEIMDDPVALGNREKMAAAKDTLDRAGLKQSEKVEVKTESPLFILPPKGEDG